MSNSEHIQVLIVGAGLSGAIAGFCLQRKGIETKILEIQNISTRKGKLCGGIMSNNSMNQLADIFGEDARSLIKSYISHEVYNNLATKKGSTLDVNFVSVIRKELDDYALNKYLEAGGTIQDRLRIDSISPEEHTVTAYDMDNGTDLTIQYGTLIAADGAFSKVRRLLGEKDISLAFAMEAEDVTPSSSLDPDSVYINQFFGSSGMNWVIPQGDNIVNIGAVQPDITRGSIKSLMEGIKYATSTYGLYYKHCRGAVIPAGKTIKLHDNNSIFFVGDAAGLIHPYLFGGIHYCIQSGKNVAVALEGESPEEKYDSLMKEDVDFITNLLANIEK